MNSFFLLRSRIVIALPSIPMRLSLLGMMIGLAHLPLSSL
jgi:hypothetical protein